MRTPTMILAVLMAFVASACGSSPVTATGDGWTAEFPGEFDTATQEIPVPTGDPVIADSYVWESSDAALTILVTPFPSDLVSALPVETLLDSTAQGAGGEPNPDSPLLTDGMFLGLPAVAFDITQEGFSGSGLAFFDETVLYQLLGITEGDGAPESFTTMVQSFMLDS